MIDDARLILSGPERLVTGAVWAEGPVWLPEARRVRFSDIRTDRILEWGEGMTEPEVYGEHVEFTNGRALDGHGVVVQCSHGRRRVERDDGGRVASVVDRFGDARLNSPNDVVVARDGAIWFTDPPYGITQPEEGHAGEQEYRGCFVFRLPTTGPLEPVVTDMTHPNGLALSPDERMLYVADTAAEARDGERGLVRAYPVGDDGRVGEGRVLIEPPGAVDGFRVDTEGRLWVTAGEAVEVYTADGTLLEHVDMPELSANLCFGGDDGTDVFVTASSSLYRLRTSARDAVHARSSAGATGDGAADDGAAEDGLPRATA